MGSHLRETAAPYLIVVPQLSTGLQVTSKSFLMTVCGHHPLYNAWSFYIDPSVRVVYSFESTITKMDIIFITLHICYYLNTVIDHEKYFSMSDS